MVADAKGEVALETEYAFALYMMETEPPGKIGDGIARRSEYAERRGERYPDPANLLPDSVAARIIMHSCPVLELL